MVQMNILIYNWRDIKNPGAGGAEMFMQEDVKRWVEKENKVILFTSAFTGCKRGEVVCEPNSGAMAERVVELLQDDMLQERLSRNALAWAREFSWGRSIEGFLKAIGAYV